MVLNFQDPQIWVAISFIIFFLAFGNLIWKKISIFLENKINIIDNEIKEAQSLHLEASNLLIKEKRKGQELENKIKKILEDGKIKTNEIVKKSKEKINKEVINLESNSNIKIKLLEQEIIEKIKLKIMDKAIENTIMKLQQNLSHKDHKNILAKALKKVESNLENNKKL
tara:strand:- start:81 stop:587 length:507 start_codon:yes stop_codon:yes gene_type:complete